ncbi:hypothetical protein COF07_10325 [Bacillus wiedmannii]|uniref:hypothetical protein n=1 Tax=Bacillus wiedmannii TaxID=1890302 RepID=UPI000BFB9581|nr:hypothetical protein [Bacillus wiedmannii]PHA58728.1 hypothetical protein COF07_10325 [Bacillus wiedmannii]
MELTNIFQTLNITYYVAAGLFLLKTCTIIKASSIEKLFFNQEKVLFIQILHVIIFAIFITPITILYFYIFSDRQLNISDINDIIGFIIVSLLVSTVVVLEIYVPYLSDPLGKDAYYIKLNDGTKVYLIKSLNKLEILGYSHPRLKRIDKNNSNKNQTRILEKEYVKNTVIFRERYKDSLLEKIKNWTK